MLLSEKNSEHTSTSATQGIERDWIAFFKRAAAKGNVYELDFFAPASETELAKTEALLGAQLPPHLKALLRQTNGIDDTGHRSGYLLWSCEMMVEHHTSHLEFLEQAGLEAPDSGYLFFADNGCGEHFGYVLRDGVVAGEEIGVYYPIENAFRVVAADFDSWANAWLGSELAT